jgi:hypothetical protein
MRGSDNLPEVISLLKRAKRIAKQYRRLTGRPLGITGEVAEVAAVEALKLKMAPVRQDGFDATRRRGSKLERLQIKGRCILDPSKPGGRAPSIKFNHPWDVVLLVLLDQDLELTEIYEARRRAVKRFLTKPGSKARNERGSMAVEQFKRIGKRVWPKA